MERMPNLIRRLVNCPGVRWSLVALSVYTVTTVVMMYPVPFQLDSVIAGGGYGDGFQYTWSLWWARQAILEPGGSLAHIPLMNHPAGVEHPFLLTMFSVDLMALPFTLLFPPAVVYNLQLLLAFILSGMTMYWLCTELVDDHRAGIVGGFIFAFFLNKTGHVLAGHLPQVTVYWFPLYILFLRRAVRKPGWRTALAAAFALVPACLVHVMHLAYLVLPVTIVVLITTLLKRGRGFFTWRRMGSLVLVFGLAAVVALPFLLPTVLLSQATDGYLSAPGTIKHSTDLLAFFTPSPFHPVLRPLGLVPSFAERVFKDINALGENLAYPGLVAAGLALWGLVRRPRRTWPWVALALVVAVLSLGPLLKVNKRLLQYQVDGYKSYLVLPYALLKEMPLLSIGRTPGRLNGTVMFAVSIVASYGAAALFGARALARRAWPTVSLFVLLLLGMGFEYVAVWPFPVSTAEIPPAIRRIADEPGDGALMHLPMTLWREVNNQALYYQTATRRPIVRGYIHRTPPEVVTWSATLLGLAQPDPSTEDVIPRPALAERVAWLRHFDVDYVIFHKLRPEADAVYRDFVHTMLGPPKYEDYAVAAFSVLSDTSVPERPRHPLTRLYTLSEEGWHPPERDGGFWRRWMSDDAGLYIFSDNEEVGSLRFIVDSHLEFPVLEVYLGERLLDAVVVDQRGTYTTRPFTLTQGLNVLRFHAPGGCPQLLDDPRCWDEALLAPPTDDDRLLCDPGGIYTTCRTFVFDRISFLPREDLSIGEGLDVNFGDQMRLRGWGLDTQELRPGGAMTVTLAWEPAVELNDRHVVFVHLLAPDGTLVAQDDAPPVGKLSPPSAWPPGATFAYPVKIELPSDLPIGDYRLLVGAYLWPGLERLPVLADVPGAESRVMVLASLRITP